MYRQLGRVVQAVEGEELRMIPRIGEIRRIKTISMRDTLTANMKAVNQNSGFAPGALLHRSRGTIQCTLIRNMIADGTIDRCVLVMSARDNIHERLELQQGKILRRRLQVATTGKVDLLGNKKN